MVTALAEGLERSAPTHGWLVGGALALLFALAVGARLVGIGLFITPDEDNWMRRTGNFAEALQSGDLQRTFQSGHPGVTTMWIARLGIGPEAARLAGVTRPDWPVTREPGFMELLVRARLAFVAVNAALVVAIVALAWRLAGAGPALLGGVVLALDPFLIAHSQVVHLDGLSAGLMTVAMLAGGLYWWERGGLAYLLLCGLASGLAVLTKAPSLVLGLLLPLVALAAPLLDRSCWSWRRVVGSLVVAGAVALAVAIVLWPALWVAPVDTVRRAVEFTIATSGEHRPGNFFAGRAVADPGPAFYPVAILFRLAPLTLAGLVALGVLLPPRQLRRPTALLLLFTLGFLLFLSLASKKLDRYTVPVFPALGLLAGIGLWTLVEWLRPLGARLGQQARRAVAVALALGLVVGAGLPLLMVAPYPLAYYNRLVGGGPAAAKMLLVGWGEGLDQVAAYLSAQPGIDRQLVAIYFPLELNFQGMVPATVTQYGDPRPVHYVVDYVNAAQRGQTPAEVAARTPDYEVWIQGILYARVYHLDPPRRIHIPGSTASSAPGR